MSKGRERGGRGRATVAIATATVAASPAVCIHVNVSLSALLPIYFAPTTDDDASPALALAPARTADIFDGCFTPPTFTNTPAPSLPLSVLHVD